MTDEQIVLARRAVACNGWRWMPGMLTADGERVYTVREAPRPALHVCGPYGEVIRPREACNPDLTDPATLGCLLALVREAWGQDTWVQHENEWTCFVVLDDQLDHYCGTSEAEALVAALEAAP